MKPITVGHFGNYFLIESIGAGGMAQVFLARTKSSTGVTKPVAIKIINPAVVAEPRMRDYFRHEAELVMGLNHANVTQVQEFGDFRGSYYLAMEFIVGKSVFDLNRKLAEKGERLGPAEVLFIAREMCEGLRYVHTFKDPSTGESMDIVHRDISPQNVMVTFEGEVKIIDFGVARTNAADEGLYSSNAGKVRYMSPEQLQGQTIDQRVDIYAVGVVLWELATGCKIFGEFQDMNVVKEKIVSGQIPILSEMDPRSPPYLSDIIRRATHPIADDRYATAQEMLEDCNLLLNQHYPSFNKNRVRSIMHDLFGNDLEAIQTKLRLKQADILYYNDKARAKPGTIKIYKEKSNLLFYAVVAMTVAGLIFLAYHYKQSPARFEALFNEIKIKVSAYINGPLQPTETQIPLREVHISSVPSGAQILQTSNKDIRWTPSPIQIPSNLNQVTIYKPGYKRFTLNLTKEQNRYEVVLELEP